MVCYLSVFVVCFCCDYCWVFGFLLCGLIAYFFDVLYCLFDVFFLVVLCLLLFSLLVVVVVVSCVMFVSACDGSNLASPCLLSVFLWMLLWFS